MIDYNKLKIAHELVERLCSSYGIQIELSFLSGNLWKYFLKLNCKKDIFEFNNIDDLITKLRQLTQPKAKYKDVYYVGAGGHIRQTVALNQDGYMFCDDTNPDALGLHITCYPTKQSLIEAQIEYWTSLRSKEFDDDFVPYWKPSFEGEIKGFNEDCQHESNDLTYMTNPPQNKCLKCGEFYK